MVQLTIYLPYKRDDLEPTLYQMREADPHDANLCFLIIRGRSEKRAGS